jgi:arsenical-resistance protein 2
LQLGKHHVQFSFRAAIEPLYMPDNEMSQTEAPWYAAYPAAKSTADSICRSEVRLWLYHSTDGGPRDFVLVDLRRNDHEGGTINGSINLPAQSLYPTIPTLFAIFSAANIKKVVWYCGQ